MRFLVLSDQKSKDALIIIILKTEKSNREYYVFLGEKWFHRSQLDKTKGHNDLLIGVNYNEKLSTNLDIRINISISGDTRSLDHDSKLRCQIYPRRPNTKQCDTKRHDPVTS